jgi:hypothetical protein
MSESEKFTKCRAWVAPVGSGEIIGWDGKANPLFANLEGVTTGTPLNGVTEVSFTLKDEDPVPTFDFTRRFIEVEFQDVDPAVIKLLTGDDSGEPTG